MPAKIITVSHPLLQQCVTDLRNRRTDLEGFRKASRIASQILFLEATRSLKLDSKIIATPLSATKGWKVKGELVVVPILRAGLAMLSAVQELYPDVLVGFVGLRRDEETAIAHRYYENIPDSFLKNRVIILDPMLATGGTLDETVTLLEKRGAKEISCISIVAAPEGIERMNRRHPRATLITAAVDRRLNAKKYIVPGLGDFGDRYFGTEV